MMPFLSVQNLSQSFGKKQIINSISFELGTGEITAFLGPNGAGKTTLLRTIIGLLPNPRNQISAKLNNIFLGNIPINDWPISKRIEQGLLYLPQQTSLFREMTVLENLKLIYEYHSYWKNQKNSKKDRWQIFKAEMDSWLEITDLSKSTNLMSGNLSGGQKRKLEVIRSILMHPKGIMLDEPFAGVDPKSIYELKKIFTDMATQNNITILISDHNVDQLLSIANKIYVVINGQIVTSGGIKDIINNDYTKEMYLGNQFYTEIAKRFL